MDDQALLELAGSRVFERGRRYHDEGRVDLSGADAEGCRALVHGTARYRVSLHRAGGELDWHCDCPAAEDGSFCKHLVAAALAWRAEVGSTNGGPAARTGDALRNRLGALPRETLAQWLHEAALDDPDLHRRIELRLAGDDPDALRSALDAALRVRGFLDYRRSMDFAARLDEPIESLRSLVGTRPDTALELTERALKRVLKILERSDDSAGTLQVQIAELGRLHAHAAARAEIDGQRFAQALHGLKQRDQWDFLPLAAYWDALGERGRAAYRARVEQEYAALPPMSAGRQHPASEGWYEDFPILQRREELAHCEADCDALIEVYSRDLGSGYAYQRLIDVCADYGREAEATRWAERGVREHPDWPGLRERLAQRYLADGLADEALEQMRRAFLARPQETLWRELRTMSAEDWPGLREDLLQQLAKRESTGNTGASRDVTLRARMLAADGDLDAAVDLALRHAVNPDTLHAIAESAADHRAVDAARLLRRVVEFELKPTDARGYPDIVRKMARIQSIDASADVREWIAEIRRRYKARRKLMQLMDAAGL